MITERAYWLAWSRLKDVGPVTIKRLWEHFGSLAQAWAAPAGDLLSVDGIGLLIADRIVAQRPKLKPAEMLAEHETENKAFWTPADPNYPALLFAINDPPPLLYYRGNLRLNDAPNVLSVGIVGTRGPSAYGKRWTHRLSSRLAREGAVIVSGLAQGIDTAAHTSCLDVQGLTVAVLGTGVDVVYPAQNRELHEQVAKTGLLVSEYPDGTGPDRTHFPQRNRIIAGLSRAILVTEAPARSGALITSRLANDYCREVYALPCALEHGQGEGCLNLINQGAQMILGEQSLVEALKALPSVEALLPGRLLGQLYGLDPLKASAHTDGISQSNESSPDPVSAKPAATVPTSELSPLLAQVLTAVSIEPVVLDNIVQLAQVETGQALSALLQLEIMGLVTQLPGMQYQRA